MGSTGGTQEETISVISIDGGHKKHWKIEFQTFRRMRDLHFTIGRHIITWTVGFCNSWAIDGRLYCAMKHFNDFQRK